MANPLKKVLVTGSSGSIGTALVEALLEGGYETVGADIRPNEWSDTVNQKTIRIDLTNRTVVDSLLPRDVDSIVHLAAHSRVWDLIENPRLAEENITMLANVVEFARACDIHKIVFSSSREVYGNTIKDSSVESDASVDACESPYAMSKIAGEALLRAYQHSFGMDSVILRFANVYGRYDITNRAIPLFIAHCRTGKPIGIFGRGKVLDFTHLDDTVRGIILTIERFDTVKNDVINIASGIGTDLATLAKKIQAQMGTAVPITVENNRTGEVMRYVGAIDKARVALGYEPTVALDEGLRGAIAWYTNFYDKNPGRIPALPH